MNQGECGCKVVSAFLCGNTIEYCPLHKSAPDLYEALEKARNYIHPDNTMVLSEIDKALAKAEGK